MSQRSSVVSGAGWVLLAMTNRVLGTVLLPRDPTSDAMCNTTQDWSWMNNEARMQPCLLAAYLISPCASSEYHMVPLNGSNQYRIDPTACSCSWAVYNLVSACTLCQGSQDAVPSWFSWSNDTCGSHLTTGRPYPEAPPITGGQTFPNYAAVYPATWLDQRFNGDQAHNIQLANPGDWHANSSSASTSRNSKHSSNVGAIVGGVVGGIVAIAIGIAAALFLYCRSQKRQGRAAQPVMSQGPVDHHVRSPSDLSAKTFGANLAYTPLGHSSPSNGSDSRLLYSPTTFRTHNTSRNSFTQESLMASMVTNGLTTPPPHSTTPTPHVYHTSSGVVSPFTLERPSSSQDGPISGHDRKRSEASAHLAEAGGSSTAQGPGRMNPPAYSEAPHGHGDFSSQAPDQASTYGASTSIITTPPSGRPHEKSPSVSSMLSHHSNSSATSAGFFRNSASLSGAADLISQMNSGNLPGPSGAAPAYTNPGPSVHVPRDEKRRPSVMNQAPSEGEHAGRQ